MVLFGAHVQVLLRLDRVLKKLLKRDREVLGSNLPRSRRPQSCAEQPLKANFGMRRTWTLRRRSLCPLTLLQLHHRWPEVSFPRDERLKGS